MPLFDGRSTFLLSLYNELTCLDDELHVGDFALVAFTLGGWLDPNVNAAHVTSQRVALNIQLAILLERPVDEDQDGFDTRLTDEMKNETPLGVSDITPMKPMLPNELTREEIDARIAAARAGPAM